MSNLLLVNFNQVSIIFLLFSQMEDYSMLSHSELGTHMYDVSIVPIVI